MFRLVAIVVLLAASIIVSDGALAESGRRVALVVGNGQYRNVDPLVNPENDARLIATTLQAAGFTLIGGGPQLDVQKSLFDGLIQQFGNALPGADTALFYYSGHGMQVQGKNWLVPIDANPTNARDLDFQMVDASLIVRQMEDSGTKLNLVLLDACRNNPFASRGLRGGTRGLAQMQAPEGTLISYATQPGNVALDGAGANSPYTSALAEVIRRPGVDVFNVFNQVGLAVEKATGGAQQPWLSSSPIAGNFYFFTGPVTIILPQATVPPVSSLPPPPSTTTPSTGLKCSEESQLRSLNANSPTGITFLNQGGHDVRAYWIDYKGARVFYSQLSPGQSYSLNTFLSHPWVITDTADNCIGVYMPSPDPKTVAVR
jgi:hypothetical protein